MRDGRAYVWQRFGVWLHVRRCERCRARVREREQADYEHAVQALWFRGDIDDYARFQNNVNRQVAKANGDWLIWISCSVRGLILEVRRWMASFSNS